MPQNTKVIRDKPKHSKPVLALVLTSMVAFVYKKNVERSKQKSIAQPSRKKSNFRYYDLILAAFAAVLLVSNLAAVKLVAFGPIITDGGAILFPLAYIFGDILTEVYGYAYARRAIWTGFGVMIVAVLAFTAVRYMPAAPEWGAQQSFVDILGFFPRIVFASLTAYLCGAFINAFILAKLKVKYGTKRLWIRLISSTVVGELVDTVVFAFIAFGGILTGFTMFKFIAIGWGFKTGVEILLLPLTYWIINFLKRHEQQDALDSDTNFTPFRVSSDSK